MTSPPNPSRRRLTKEELELEFVSRFLASSGTTPGAEPRRLPPDPPDFVVEHAGKRISIEVTRVYIDDRSGSRLREGESNKDRILSSLEDELAAAGLGPLLVFVGFSDGTLPGREGKQLVGKILELIRTNHRPGEQQVELHWRDFEARGEYGTTWPKGLESITLYRPPGFDAIELTTVGTGFVASPQLLLQAAIDDKEKDRPTYQDEYDETWLLMVAEFTGPASFMEADEASRDHRYRLAFDRAFFFQDFGKLWFELRRK
jgi:hypothetical protein